MNCLLSPTTDAELNKYDTHAETFPLEDVYATAPMAVVKGPLTQTLNFEEEVYSEFEQAISGRLEVVQQKLQSLSASTPSIARKPSKPAGRAMVLARLSTVNWHHVLLFGSFAFIFTLLGFDAMGLLVLLAR
jgi:hypothetical protein